MIYCRSLGFKLTLVLAAGLMWSSAVWAQAVVGQPAPEFTLTDVVSGEEVSLSDYKDKVVVVTWQSIACPWDRMRPSAGYQRVLTPLAQQWEAENREVVFLAINSNKAESVQRLASYHEKYHMTYPILKDPGNVIADAYGAQTTPHFFVVDDDEHQTLVYKGGFEKAPISPEACGQGEEAYLVPVVMAVLAGEEPPVAETKSKGCAIKRE